MLITNLNILTIDQCKKLHKKGFILICNDGKVIEFKKEE